MNKKTFFKKNLIFRCLSSKKILKINLFRNIKLFTLLFLVAFYIFQVTEMTKYVYKIQTYGKEITSIYEKNRKAEYKFLKSNSVSRTEELVEMHDFIRAENVHYINLPDLEVALR